jgi:hypothetical protein
MLGGESELDVYHRMSGLWQVRDLVGFGTGLFGKWNTVSLRSWCVLGLGFCVVVGTKWRLGGLFFDGGDVDGVRQP